MTNRFLTEAQIAAQGITSDQLANPTEPIELSIEHVFCPRHGEPFRGHWPRGYTTASMALLSDLLNNPTFETLTDGPIEAINDLLEQRPICERVSQTSLMAAYISSGIGRERRCELCGERELGAAYSMNRPGGVLSYRHVCFRCVVYRLNPAN